jgi:hypothetical protein
MGEVDKRDCFPSSGSTHGYYSSRAWHADTVYFRNEPGPYYKNDWHFIEAYFEMNTIENDVGIPNGKIRYAYDGQLLISSDSILFRTAIHPDMKFNQLFFGGYIGVGSPVDQTWWVDDLTLADGWITTSIDPDPVRPSLSIYPNPNQGTFAVECSCTDIPYGDVWLEIYDIIGHKVFSKKWENRTPLTINGLSEGIYYCCLRTGGSMRGWQKVFVIN